MATGDSLKRQSEERESATFRQTIRARTGEREEIHKKTFRKWINSKLAMAVPPLEITDLIEEVRDGHVFLSLLEVLLGTTLKREKGRMRVHKLNNVTTALKLLEKNRVKLVGISNYDIVDGKSTPILGLVWSIILRFQVQGVMQQSDSDSSVKDFQVEKKLLTWCQTVLDGYDEVKLKDFTTSWRDGLAFNAIIHTHKPELFRYESLLENDNRTNLDHAFKVANDEFSVPKLLDPADIDVDKPDKKLIVMYLTSLYHGLREYSPHGGRKRRKLDDLADLEAYREALKEVNMYIAQVENEVSKKLETTSRFVNPQEEYKNSKSLKDDIANHRQDVGDVIEKGDVVIKSGKADEIQCTEINNEILLLHERWEKLEILCQRLHKRCRGAVVSPREQQIDVYIIWIKQMRGEMSTRGHSNDPAQIKKEIREHEDAITKIERKQPEIERVMEEVNDLCQKPFIDEDDRLELEQKLNELRTSWGEVRTEALEKETNLQDKLAQPYPDEENVETEVLVQVEQDNVQSAPSEFSSLEILPTVHYLIDLEDGSSVDQTDSVDKEAEKEAKLAKLKDKRNAIMIVLRNCSGKLENLRAIGAPTQLQEVKEQQEFVKECYSELKAGEPLMQDAILYGRELTQDDLFDKDEKEDITRDMVQLQEHYDDLRNFVDDEQEGLVDLHKELERRNKIRDWERKRDDLNVKLDSCQDKLRLVKRDEKLRDAKADEDLLTAAKACYEEVSSLELEVKSVADDGNDLIRNEGLHGDQKEDIDTDIRDIEERYEELKHRSNEEVKRLEELFAQEESDKKAKLDKWQEITDKTSTLIEDSRSKLDEIKSMDPHTIPEIQEQIEQVEKCIHDLANAFPEIQSGYDYGNDLLANKRISDVDKDKVERDMDSIGQEFQVLQKDINDEQDRLNALLADASAEEERKVEKLKKWKDWRDKLNSKYKKTRGKFNKVKGQGIPKEPKKVQEQLELTRGCSSDIAESVPELQEAFKYANELTDDKDIDPKDKEFIKKDVKEIGEGFKNLKLEINDYENELENLALKQEEEKAEKVERWEIWMIRIGQLQDKCQGKMKDLKSKGEPQNKKDVAEQIILADECKVELQSAAPVIHEGLDYGRLLLDDDVIDDDKKADIKKETDEVEYDLAKMEKDNSDEYGRLEVLAIHYDTDKKDKLDKWETWKVKMRSILALKRTQLNELKSEEPSTDPKKVEEHLEKAKDCQDSLQNSEPEIKFALECGEQLIDDDITDPEDKEKIGDDVEELGQALKDLKVDTAKERIRLEQICAQQKQEKEQKLKVWEIWIIRITERERKCQEKLDNLQSKEEPENKEDVEDQIILAKEFREELESAKPEIIEGLAYGSSLLEDDLIDDESKADVKHEIENLDGNLRKLEQAKDEEQKRLKELFEHHQEKDKQQKLNKWEDWVARIKKLMSNCEDKIVELKSKGDPKDKKEVDEQIILNNECKDELQASKPEISDGLAYGWQVLEDGTMDDGNKANVRQDLHLLEEELLRLEEANSDNERRLEQIYAQQKQEKEQKLKVWEIWIIRITERERKCQEKLDNLQSKEEPEDKEDVEDQIILAKEFREELESAKPEIIEGLAYGSSLLGDDQIDDESKADVKHEIEDLDGDLRKLEKAKDEEQKRLKELFEHHQEKDKQQKLNKWEDWVARIKKLMSNCEDKLEDLKSIGDPKDKKEVDEQIILNNECKDELQASKPEISDGLAYGWQVLDDDTINDGNKANVRQDLHQLEEELLRLEEANADNERRLQDRLEALDEETGHMEDWREKCGILKSGMDAADDKIAEGKKAENHEELENCYGMLKDLSKGLALMEPEMVTTLDHGKELASSESLSSDCRKEVSEDVRYLDDRWKALMKKTEDEYARLGVQLGESQAKQRNVATWHERCDELHGWVTDRYTRLRSRPNSPEASFGGIKRQQSVIEDLVKDLVSKQGEVNDIIDDGNKIIEDNALLEGEKNVVHEKMLALHNDWNKLATLTSGKQQSVQVLLFEKEQQHLDKTQNWRRKIDPLMTWISSAETRLNTEFEIAPDLDTVKKQKHDLEDFNDDMLSHQREVSDTLGTGDKLLKDSELPEDDRTAIQKEVLDLSHRWENLEELVSWKTDRIEDTIVKLKIQQEDKLQKWHDGLGDINGWVMKTKVKVDAQTTLASDVDGALEQIDDFQEVIKDAPVYQEKVTHLNEFSGNLVSDPCLGEEERKVVRKETAICNEKWNGLVNIANAKQAKMDENLDRLERLQHDALERWRIRSERAGLALDKLEGQISVIDDPIGNNLETIRRQEDAFEIFSSEVDLNTSHMIDTFALGEQVRKDPKLTMKKKEEVTEHYNSLLARWDRVKDFIALRNERLDEASKRLQRERRNKTHDWEERLTSVDSFLRKAERETERLEPIGDDLETVRRQNDDFEHSMSLLLGPQKRVYEFGKFTDDLLADPVMDEISKQSMASDKDNRLQRWARVVDKTNNHRARLREKLSILEKSEDEVSRWEDELATINEKVEKVESICEQEISPDLEILEKQRKEAQKLKEDVHRLDPQVDEFLRNSDTLLDEHELSDKDQRTIEQEAKSLRKRWNKVKSDAKSREPRVEDEYLRSQKRQKELLDEWKNSCNSTLKWIADTSARVQAQDTTASDLDHARAQRQEIEDITKEIKQYDKQMDKLDQLGIKIVHDPSVRDFEKGLVQDEKESIIGQWQELLKNTEAAKQRLDKQIAQLEKEQREKMNMWSQKTEPLDTWLVKNETIVESYEPIGYDINYVKEQKGDAQAMITDLLHEQPKFADMTDFGNQLTTEPCVGLEERVRLQKEMQSLHQRWDGLYASATSRHDRVQERLKILEDEQRQLGEEQKRLEEEEIQRRLDEERRRLEKEKRQRKEEEERKRREEEATLRRELEERQRREEEERLRREEEEKRRLAELERKRREEEERKRREEEERLRKEEEERKKREEEERKRREQDERRKKEEERRRKEEEERRKREEEAKRRREEDERRRREEEERWEREEEERKRREEEKRKQREEDERKRKEKERKRREEEEERKRKEAEEKKKREEEEKLKAFTYITPEPRVQLVEQEPRLFSSPVVDEVIVSIDDNVVEAGVDPGMLEEKLDDWKKEADDIDAWLKDQEDNLPDESDEEDTLPSLKAKEGKITSIEKELPVYDKRYHDLEKDFEELMNDNYIQENQPEAIGEEMDNLRVRWRSLNNNKDTKKQRLKNKIWDEEQKKAGELAGCRVNLQAVKNWIDLRDKELGSMEPIGNVLSTLARQKEDMKQFSKRIKDYEPRFTETTDTAYKLCKDPAFSNEQNKALQHDAEDCEQKWDDVLDKVKDRMDSIVKKIPKLQKNQTELLEEWKDNSARFEKSLKKTEEKLKEQSTVGRELGYEKWSPESRSPELARRQRENDNEWKPVVDESNARLRSIREKLQDIQREKKNRKWSMIEALKDVVHSITTRFRGGSKSAVSLDKVVDLLEDHEDIMSDTSSKQKDANEVFALSANAIDSGVLQNAQANDIQDRMSDLNRRWNVLNINVIEREKRLEKFAEDVESEYERFDTWRDRCDNMNQWLSESEKLIKNEENVGTDIAVIQEQIQDNQLFFREVKQYEPKVEAMLKDSQELVESSKLDKTDIDGVDKTKNALTTRWKDVNDHLKDRQQKLDSALLGILKKDTEGRLDQWREQSIALGLLVTDASRRVNEDVDETDYGDIQASAVQLQQVESSLGEDLSKELLEVTDSGRDIIEKNELQPDDGDKVNETMDTLNRQVSDLERGTRQKKDRIQEASLKYFGRSLADCEHAVERLEDASANFSDIGSDIGEVGKQLGDLQEFESDMVKEEAKFSDIKDQFEDGKETGIFREEDKARVQRRIGVLNEKWAELNRNHNDNHRRLTQAMIVLHEELMEEIYDWMSDAEKQADSIAVNEDNISSVMEEYDRHRELKEEISSFEPTFKKAIGISDRLLRERLVDPERADSYETEIDSLEKRWTKLQLKTMDNGTKLSGVLGKYITTRLDDAEVTLTRAESSIDRDDGDYLDLEAAKKALVAFKDKKEGVHESQTKVDEILTESRAIVKEDFFREHERDHFQGRIEIIDKRNNALEDKAAKEERRLLDTYILLLKQHLQRLHVWLNMAESRIKAQGEIGPGYDDVKKQLEDHQVFQEELRDHSMISMIVGVDVTHPAVSESTHQQVKSLSDRWSKVWNWSEHRKTQLLKVLSNWQRFRDEQLILLNWLSNKEKTLKDMGRTDLTDEDEVKEHLEKLRVIEKELDEQGVRLQSLHKAGDDLLKNVDEGDPAAKEIKTQLKDFDDCWNDIAKQVINRIQQLESSQSKLGEFHSEMDATNEWMDDTEKLLKSFNVGMDPEEASKLQEKTEMKCEERARYAAKVDRINRLGKDLAGEIDQPSHDAIQDELQPFNARWSDVSIQLENVSDKGYPQPQNECCLIRLMKRKFGAFQ